jgi:hypothetical protein
MLFKDSVPTTKKTQHFTITKSVREIIAVYSENHTKTINALLWEKCGVICRLLRQVVRIVTTRLERVKCKY